MADSEAGRRLVSYELFCRTIVLEKAVRAKVKTSKTRIVSAEVFTAQLHEHSGQNNESQMVNRQICFRPGLTRLSFLRLGLSPFQKSSNLTFLASLSRTLWPKADIAASHSIREQGD